MAFPDEALCDKDTIQPDDNFLQYLRDTLPGLRETLPENATSKDKEKCANYQAAVLASAFYVDPGADARQLGYPVRVGLLVVDVLAEFGAENTQLFVKDEGIRSVVKAVLERFAKPDLESFDEWSPFLRHALSATLNGVLDAAYRRGRATTPGSGRFCRLLPMRGKQPEITETTTCWV